MNDTRIVRIEWACLQGRRPRVAGCNARLPAHGDTLGVPIMRLTTADGAQGFGACGAKREPTEELLLGKTLGELFGPEVGVRDAWRWWEYPLWDLAGKALGQPIWKLACAVNSVAPPDAL